MRRKTIYVFDGNGGSMPAEQHGNYDRWLKEDDFLSFAMEEIGLQDVYKYYPEIITHNERSRGCTCKCGCHN